MTSFLDNPWLDRLFGRRPPVFAEAETADAAGFATLHAACFHRGWSEEEFERLLLDPQVIADRAGDGARIDGFIMSRLAADEAEILSVAVKAERRRRGLARVLLDIHLRRLGSLGITAVFLEVEETNAAARRLYSGARFREVGRREGYYAGRDGTASALVLRRDLP